MTVVADRRELLAEYAELLEEQTIRKAERSLFAFIEQAWLVIEPHQPFVHNWHIGAIAEHLEAVAQGEIQNLLINIPPGCMKTLITSVFNPAWQWTKRPWLRFLCASYDQALSTRDNLRCRNLIESEWYQSRWGHVVQLADDQNQKTRYNTSEGGWRIGTSVGGGRATGEHPHHKIIDDPHDRERAHSDVERQSAIDWFDQTLSSRGAALNASTVVIMQRLHEKDLSGHILGGAQRADWTHICLPMRYEPKRMVQTPLKWTDVRRQPGELLWPALFPPAEVTKLEAKLTSYGAAGQLQQRPAPAEGGVIKRRWWRYYRMPPMPRLDEIVLSWDTALKDRKLSDFWAGQAWGRRGADVYLLRGARGRWDLIEGKQQIADMYGWARDAFPGVRLTVLIENAAAGPDAIAQLKRKVPGIIGITPKGDKVQRTFAVTPTIEAGNAWIPGAAQPNGEFDSALTPAWVQEFLSECAAFPNAANDDQVDAMSQALLRLVGGTGSVAVIKAGQRGRASTPAPEPAVTVRDLHLLEELVAQHGSDAVTTIRRHTEPHFELPAHLRGIPPGGL